MNVLLFRDLAGQANKIINIYRLTRVVNLIKVFADFHRQALFIFVRLLKYTGFAGISRDFGELSKSAQKVMEKAQRMRINFCEAGRDILLFVTSPGCEACLIRRGFLSLFQCWFHVLRFCVSSCGFLPLPHHSHTLRPRWLTTPASIFSCWPEDMTGRFRRLRTSRPTRCAPTRRRTPT